MLRECASISLLHSKEYVAVLSLCTLFKNHHHPIILILCLLVDKPGTLRGGRNEGRYEMKNPNISGTWKVYCFWPLFFPSSYLSLALWVVPVLLSETWTEAEPTGAKSCGELSLALHFQRHLLIHLARCQLQSSLHWSMETERKKAEQERGSGGRRKKTEFVRKQDEKSAGKRVIWRIARVHQKERHKREKEQETEREGGSL